MRAAERVLAALALAAAASPAALLARGDGSFEAPVRFPVPTPLSVAAGDFNRDGKLDLAAVNGTGSVLLFLQSPLHADAWRRPRPVMGVAAGYSIRSADLDLDGDDDLVVAGAGPTALLRSKGDGTFERTTLLTPAQFVHGVAVGDWNGDGALDLATADGRSWTVSIYMGKGDGTAARLRSYHLGGDVQAIESLDYDGDRNLDLMAGTLGSAGLVPIRGRGDASFEVKTPRGNSAGCGMYLVPGDLDGDGRDDLVTSCGVWLSLGGGNFQRPLTGLLGYSAAVADLNGDGLKDLAFGGSPPGGVTVHLGKGNGQFHPRSVLALPVTDQGSMLFRDLDGDLRLDLITADGLSAITILRGRAGEGMFSVGRLVGGLRAAKVMAVTDVDRDGSPDLICPRSDMTGVLAILDPTSTSSGQGYPLGTSYRYTSLEVGDSNDDGIPDLAGTDLAAGMAQVALLGQIGSVKSQAQMPAGSFPSGLAAGRLDEDSTLDLAVACLGSNHVAVFLGLGGGAFRPGQTVPTISRPLDLETGDLDRDGLTDLAVASERGVALHRGKGGGEFAGPTTLLGQSSRPSDVAIGDMNGDSLLDVVVSDAGGILLFRGKPGGDLDPAERFSLTVSPHSLVLADLDGDGLTDITASSQAGGVSVLLSRGPQGFGDPLEYRLDFPVMEHRVADLDRDGALDLALLLNTGRTAMILRGRSAPPSAVLFRRGDVDQDGRLQVTDPIRLLDRLFLGGEPFPCEDAADSNDDGAINVTDAITLLERLFLGGPPLPPPGPIGCGEDPGADTLAECHADC